MRIPAALAPLTDYGIIDEVLRPLMSGKEAQVYLVRASGEYRVVKVYKDAENRTFKNRADYTEGRKVRNSRDQRAMGKGSRHGRAQAEAAWRSTEVDMIYRLRDAGVRVPTPYHFVDGVFVMEMITDAQGEPAPRLGDVVLEVAEARAVFETLLAEVVRMLAAGVVHGDLSDFNVLMGRDGPVIIDFPQAVDASSNRNARTLLLRDVDNLHRFMARFAPEQTRLPYAEEMWSLYERGELRPDTTLSGRYRALERKVNTDEILGLIGEAARDERRRREALGLSMRGAPAEPQLPRPRSRYAQKRDAQVAARLLEAEAAAQSSGSRSAQSAPRGRAGQASQPRGRTRHADVAGQGRVQHVDRARQRRAKHAGAAGHDPAQHPDKGGRGQAQRPDKAEAPQKSVRPHERRPPPPAPALATGDAAPQKRRRRRRKRKTNADV